MAHEHAKPGTVIDLNTFGEDKSTALVKETKFEVIRMIVEASKSIPPHKTDGPVTGCSVSAASASSSWVKNRESWFRAPGSIWRVARCMPSKRKRQRYCW